VSFSFSPTVISSISLPSLLFLPRINLNSSPKYH
jgi:hypothetical protein